MIECNNCGALNEGDVCSNCGFRILNEHTFKQDEDPEVIVRKMSRPVILGKGLFTMGSFGSMVVMMSSLYIGIIMYLNFSSGGELFKFDDSNLFYMFVSSIIILLAGFILMSIGFLGFYSSYSNKVSLLTTIMCIILPVIFFVITVIGIDSYSFGSYYESYHYYELEPWLWVGQAFIGFTLIFIGISLLSVREFTGMKKRCTSTAIFSFVTGGLLICGIGLIALAWFFLTYLAIILCLIFIRSPIKPYPKMVLIPYYTNTSQYMAPPSDEVINSEVSEMNIPENRTEMGDNV
ncbi:MAG: hypothetical protein KAS16_00935 [Thermoplasmata archaeon]|nr:hypothetical protein [Thermoplasmata archaeon]